MNQYIVYAIVLFCSILGSFGQLMFKIGSKPFNLLIIFGGLVLYGIAMVLFTWMLRYGQLHVLYPIIAMSYVFVSILSSIYLKESVSASHWVGIFLIIFGVAIVMFK